MKYVPRLFSLYLMEEDIKEVAWEKALKVEGIDSGLFRKDACGAWIRKDLYGEKEDPFGWDIDLVFPKRLGGKPILENVRALNSKNIISKGNDYPSYRGIFTSEGIDNIEREQFLTVNPKKRQELKKYFPDA